MHDLSHSEHVQEFVQYFLTDNYNNGPNFERSVTGIQEMNWTFK
jgi:hypothetical protein